MGDFFLVRFGAQTDPFGHRHITVDLLKGLPQITFAQVMRFEGMAALVKATG